MNDNVVLAIFGLIIISYIGFCIFHWNREENSITRAKERRESSKKTTAHASDLFENGTSDNVMLTARWIAAYEKAFDEIKNTLRSDIYDSEIHAFLTTLIEITVQTLSSSPTEHIESLQAFLLYVRVKKFNHISPEKLKEICDTYFYPYYHSTSISLGRAISDRFVTEDGIEKISNDIKNLPTAKLFLIFLQKTHLVYANNARPSKSIFGFADTSVSGLYIASSEVTKSIEEYNKKHRKKEKEEKMNTTPITKSIEDEYKFACDTISKLVEKNVPKSAYFFETEAFLLFITDLVFSRHKNRAEVFEHLCNVASKNVNNQHSAAFSNRLELYGKVVRGEIKARGDCISFEVPDNMNAFGHTYIVFGDILFNPQCAVNYESAPVFIESIFSHYNFSETFTQKVIPEIDQYIKSISSLRDNS